MSDYKEKTFLKCSDCHQGLTTFEEHKWHNLVNHWGGKKVTEPRCTKHYWGNIKKVQEKNLTKNNL